MTNHKVGTFLFIAGSFFTLAIILYSSFITPIIGTPLDWRKHDDNLEKFAQEFERVTLPQNIKQLGLIYKEFGLMGNSNHCDYLVSKLIQTDVSKVELSQYVGQLTLPPVDPNVTPPPYIRHTV